MGIDDKADAQALLTELEHPCKGDRFRHYKGGHYVVLEVGLQEDTMVPMVVYEDAHHPERGVWIRTLANFTEPVRLADGTTRPRFLLIV
jgi:hypothetical protein